MGTFLVPYVVFYLGRRLVCQILSQGQYDIQGSRVSRKRLAIADSVFLSRSDSLNHRGLFQFQTDRIKHPASDLTAGLLGRGGTFSTVFRKQTF